MDENGQEVWQWAISGFGEVEPTTAQTGWVRERNGSAGQISNTLPVTFNLRFPGQQFDEETGLHYNHHRYYDPYLTVGYTEADPLGLAAGWNRFVYVDGNLLGALDPDGLHKRDKWYGFNNRKFHCWFHRCWKKAGDPDANKEEIIEAHNEWLRIGSPDEDKCDGNLPPPPPEPSEFCGETCEKSAAVITTGGAAYVIYRCLRMLPSFLPPFWPSIPANATIP